MCKSSDTTQGTNKDGHYDDQRMEDWVFCNMKYIICNTHDSTACSMQEQDSWEEPRDEACSNPSSYATIHKVLKEILLGQEKLWFKGLSLPYKVNFHMSISKQTNLVEEKYYSYSCIPKDTTHKVPDNGSNSVLNDTCNYKRIEKLCKHEWTQILVFFPTEK